MQKFVGSVLAALFLIFSLLPLAVMLQFIPSYIANPDVSMTWYVVAAVVWAVAMILMVMVLRNPLPGREMTGRKALWTGLLTAAFFAVFIPVTFVGAGPAVVSLFRHEASTLTLPITDATMGAGRRSCDGRVELDGLWFLSTVCGVPEDLRSQMTPGDMLELTGQGHSMGLRVEQIRLIPKG
ncbi:MAG: hypothetical protein ACRCSU_13480 [Paracoccaceae bacterium]